MDLTPAQEYADQVAKIWETKLGDEYIRCKCVWGTRCASPAKIDGWCLDCNIDHREGS